MSFRFSTSGHRIDDELFHRLKSARRLGLHGDLQFVKALASNKFEVTTASGGTRVVHGSVRVANLVQSEINAEPARREAWKASRNGGFPAIGPQ